ncbi:MAG: Trm112 family protein [Nitrospiraceae bacterium]|nr:Trm112 family protein [Nitrospiraceae bacterium]
MGVDPFLLSILVCPKCHGSLTLRNNPDGLFCQPCGLLYPVRDDIPVMLVEEAIPLATAGEGRP